MDIGMLLNVQQMQINVNLLKPEERVSFFEEILGSMKRSIHAMKNRHYVSLQLSQQTIKT